MLTEPDILDVWDRAAALPAPRRAALMLAVEDGEPGAGDLTLGERNRRLLALRRRLYGPTMAVCVECQGCGERLEADLDAAALAGPPSAPIEHSATIDGYEVRYRPVTGADMEAIAASLTRDAARAVLLDRCVVAVRRDGAEVAVSELPSTVTGRLAVLLAQADTGADLVLALQCPECGHRWESGLDVAALLWNEIGEHARRLLYEVHLLASAYGWTEPEILAVPAARRQAYLRLVAP